MSKQSQFIQKSQQVHNNKYDYSLVEYINSKQKVKIICPSHGLFTQTPVVHKSGHGCAKCGLEANGLKRRKNYQLVCDQVPDQYKVIGIDNKNLVTMICQIHGEFNKGYSAVKQGCPKCSHKKKALSRNQWLDRVKERHNSKYDYSLVTDFDNNRQKIKIICPDHGIFEQTVGGHMQYGCKKCAYGAIKKTWEEYLERFRNRHGDRYDYSDATFVDAYTVIKIKCTKHGLFEQKPYVHQDADCPECALDDKKLTQEEFICRAIAKHGSLYDYHKVRYVNSSTKVCIICPRHGDFWQTPNDHYNGGCQKCSIDNHSRVEAEWLNYLGIQERNVTLIMPCGKRFVVDGFCKATNTVYEFNGDFWHGNPSIFDPKKWNKRCKKSFGELYAATILKQKTLEEYGYRVVCIWESEWKKQKDSLLDNKSNESKKNETFDDMFSF